MKPIMSFKLNMAIPKPLCRQMVRWMQKKGRELPSAAFDCWAKLGFSKFLGGYLQITNPRKYTDVIEKWISENQFSLLGSYLSVTIDAFGRMQYWE